MNKGLLISSAIGLVLVGGVAVAQTNNSNDDGAFDGPGYYLEDLATYPDGHTALFKVGGPFASIDACQAYWQQNPQSRQPNQTWTDSYQCNYRGSDPNYEPCFLTTACVRHAGLPDDCEELMIMRAFRDRYLNGFEEGRLLIDHYYRVAPRIVERIQRSPRRDQALRWILHEVRGTARSIGQGEREAAIARYAAMVRRLQAHCDDVGT